jgi:glucose-1-phosphate thymidylyltransferase
VASSTISTAVVLARGLGTRMQRAAADALRADQLEAARRGAKALMPIGRHTLVDHVVSALADAGIERVVLVVPPDHNPFADHFARVAPARVRVQFAVQAEPRGTADAVLAAAPVVGAEPFVLVNGDNHYPVPAVDAVRAAGPHAMGGFTPASVAEGGNVPIERVWRYAFVWHDAEGWLTDIVEKPSTTDMPVGAALVSMNLWAFGPAVFTACARVHPSVRGELELADAVRLLVGQMGERVRVVPVQGPVLDLSARGDVALVERLLAGGQVRL